MMRASGRRSAGAAALVVALVGILGGCGNALVARGYAGEPLFQIEGIITDWRLSSDLEQDLTASVFWSLTGATSEDPAQLIEQRSVSLLVIFPATFRINIFEAPSHPRLAALADPCLVGEILIYADEDRDGRYAQEELRGGALNGGILYTHRPVAKEDSPTGYFLPRGFSLVKLPLPCEARTGSVVANSNACGVPLGAPCTGDNDCGTGGSCLLNDVFGDYPGGYCVLPLAGPCEPENGVIIEVDVGIEVPDQQEQPGSAEDDRYTWVWMKECLSDHDCRSDGYECDVAFAVCMPLSPVFVDVDPGFVPPPLCLDGPYEHP